MKTVLLGQVTIPPVVCVFQFDPLILYPSHYFDEFLKHMMMYKKGLKRTVFISSF